MSMKTLPATAMSRSADFARTYHHVVVDPSATLEDILRPSFWAHHTSRIRAHDMIDVLTADGGIDVSLRAMNVAIGMVEMRALRVWVRDDVKEAGNDAGEVSEEMPPVPEGYKVNHAPKTGWRVLMEDPAMELSRNHRSRREATLAAIAHAAKANAVAA